LVCKAAIRGEHRNVIVLRYPRDDFAAFLQARPVELWHVSLALAPKRKADIRRVISVL
jgi:hypothetical protein